METAAHITPPAREDLVRSAQTIASRARVGTVFMTIGAGLLGAVIGAAAGRARNDYLPLAGMIVGGLIGFVLGNERAFEAKIRAQTLLCLASIEESCRRM